MLKNHFKIVLRQLLKDRQFTLLNLIGLSTGLACALLIYLWVTDERDFDRFHAKDSRLFQVMAQQQNAEGLVTISITPALLATALEREIPEVEYATASQGSFSGKYTLSINNKHFKSVGTGVGKNYLSIFSWNLIEGDKNQVFAEKNSIVLTKELARKLFNTTENVIGKTVQWQLNRNLKVTGLIDDVPSNSSIQFDFLFPIDILVDENPYMKEWESSDPFTYVLLKKGVNAEQFNQKIKGFLKTKVTDSKTTLFARRFSDGYLYGKYENGVQAGGRIEYVNLFSAIAIFILVIACINFMNLSTAKASKRLKEVGVKKVLGAGRRSLVLQFMIEAMFMALLALIVAGVLVWLFIGSFSDITGKQLSFHFDGEVFFTVIGITLFTGIVSGSYPALYLSGFDPITVLKGKLRGSLSELWVRRGLVIFQFALSVVFIIAVLVVYKQVAFIQSRNQGFNKDNVISFDMEGMTPDNQEVFLSGVASFVSEVKTVPGVVNASSMDHGSIINDFGSTADINWVGKKPEDVINFANIGVNYGMIETLGMKIMTGRSFSREQSSDSSEVIFNEAAIDIMGLRDPIGKVVRMWEKDRRIVGVVKNFNFQTLHESVRPFVLRLEPKLTYRIVAKIKLGQESETIERVKALFQGYNPGYVFDYRFLDQDYQNQYITEKRVAVLSKYFSILAILISCLGLFGLAAFTAQRRQKEISIRKAVGASVGNITFLLSKDFIQLVLISIVVAFPLSWLMMNKWLGNFVYHIKIGVDVFLIAALSVVFITLFTISFQSLGAAMANPTKSLRSE